jgi:chromosome segregation ATPase
MNCKTDNNGETLPLAIFDGVIAIFNASQPDFIKSCLDVEAQRRYLYQAMDDSLKEYLARIGDEAKQNALTSWAEERANLQSQLKALQQQCKQAEASQEEQQQQKLSAQRQKRALSDRIVDLEKQVAELEAEREQYELETKSLANKLKVADVRDTDLVAQRNEITSLKERLRQAELTIAQKAEQLQKAESVPSESANETVINELKEKLHQAELTIAQKDEQLKKAMEPNPDDAKVMAEIQERLSHFEDVKRKKDELLDKKTSQIEQQAAVISQLENEVSELNAQLAKAREQQIKTEAVKGEKPIRKSRREDGTKPQKVKISAIDGNAGIEWLLTTPGEDETVSKVVSSSQTDADFGYQPPLRKEIVVDNDAQLSLF